MPLTQNPKLKTQNYLIKLSSENQLLILSAHLHFDPESAECFKKALQSDLNWEKILRTAKRLGLQQLLYKHLSADTCRPLAPTHILKALKDAYQKQAFRSLRIQAQLRQLLTEAHKRKIPASP